MITWDFWARMSAKSQDHGYRFTEMLSIALGTSPSST